MILFYRPIYANFVVHRTLFDRNLDNLVAATNIVATDDRQMTDSVRLQVTSIT